MCVLSFNIYIKTLKCLLAQAIRARIHHTALLQTASHTIKFNASLFLDEFLKIVRTLSLTYYCPHTHTPDDDDAISRTTTKNHNTITVYMICCNYIVYAVGPAGICPEYFGQILYTNGGRTTTVASIWVGSVMERAVCKHINI